MDLPYHFVVQQINDENGRHYYAHVLKLDGCQSTGETLEEAYKNLKDAMQGWIQTKVVNLFLKLDSLILDLL